MKINEISYMLGAFLYAPKKAPEFAPVILRRNAIFCFLTSNKKSPDSIENQSFS